MVPLFMLMQQEVRGSNRGCKLHKVFEVSVHGLLRARNLEQIWTRVSTSITQKQGYITLELWLHYHFISIILADNGNCTNFVVAYRFFQLHLELYTYGHDMFVNVMLLHMYSMILVYLINLMITINNILHYYYHRHYWISNNLCYLGIFQKVLINFTLSYRGTKEIIETLFVSRNFIINVLAIWIFLFVTCDGCASPGLNYVGSALIWVFILINQIISLYLCCFPFFLNLYREFQQLSDVTVC